jgi:hypothetical protein
MRMETAYVGKIITTPVHELKYIVFDRLGARIREYSGYHLARSLTDSSEIPKVNLRKSLRASSSSSSRS